MNPIATLYMANGSKVVIELFPENAPNTVNSFIWAASNGYLDNHTIERIVPGNWIDMSYSAFIPQNPSREAPNPWKYKSFSCFFPFCFAELFCWKTF